MGTSTAVSTTDNRQDFANVTQLYPSSESGGAYASILRTINPQITAFANVLYSRSLTHYELQPYGFTNSLAGITLPATNPYNPTGLSLTNTTTSFPYLFRGRTPYLELGDRGQLCAERHHARHGPHRRR